MILKDLIADVNVNEIYEHIETETLSEWVNAWQKAALAALRPVSREQVERALAMMWFAYVNSDKETPHSYETDALEEAESILGPWAECMPKYLKRGPEEG